jgi:hypothetical protein
MIRLKSSSALLACLLVGIASLLGSCNATVSQQYIVKWKATAPALRLTASVCEGDGSGETQPVEVLCTSTFSKLGAGFAGALKYNLLCTCMHELSRQHPTGYPDLATLKAATCLTKCVHKAPGLLLQEIV